MQLKLIENVIVESDNNGFIINDNDGMEKTFIKLQNGTIKVRAG